MLIGVVTFPGSNCDHDVYHACKHVVGVPTRFIWHRETALGALDAVILPGGFSYGDYLRAGAMAAGSPVVAAVRRFAAQGGPVLGICNGFQILCEAGLLPGALLRNAGLRFVCRDVHLLLSGRSTPFTAFLPAGRILRLPIAHAEGRYFHQRAEDLEAGDQVVFSYCDRAGGVVEAANPNGSLANIAGICSREGNVLGLMPHPERAAEPILGGVDGRGLLESLLRWLEARAPAVGTGADGGRGTTTIAAGVAGGGS